MDSELSGFDRKNMLSNFFGSKFLRVEVIEIVMQRNYKIFLFSVLELQIFCPCIDFFSIDLWLKYVLLKNC